MSLLIFTFTGVVVRLAEVAAPVAEQAAAGALEPCKIHTHKTKMLCLN